MNVILFSIILLDSIMNADEKTLSTNIFRRIQIPTKK